ncbi:MAG: DUF1987 domain-containing protein [Thermonemataceae bacterium]|nr:DUF1987 domain-containing protein [Thermonemataceae bacterium]
MENLIIKETEQTAEVLLDAKEGVISFSGVSIPEDSYSFFTPILRWLEQYSESPQPKTKVVFNIMYCNTSSSMYISEILRKLRRLKSAAQEIEIIWYFEEDDIDMRMLGEDFKRISQLNFKVTPLK